MRKLSGIILSLIFTAAIINFTLAAKPAAKKSTGKTIKKAEVVGMVSFVIGKATIKKAGSTKWLPLKLKTKLTEKDQIKTPDKSRVKIMLKDKKIVEIKSKSTVLVSSLLKKSKTMAKKGSLKSLFMKSQKGNENKYGVTAVGGVRGDDVSKKKQKVKADDVEWDE